MQKQESSRSTFGRFARKEPPTFGFEDRHSTNCARPMVALLAKNYAPIVEVAGLEPIGD